MKTRIRAALTLSVVLASLVLGIVAPAIIPEAGAVNTHLVRGDDTPVPVRYGVSTITFGFVNGTSKVYTCLLPVVSQQSPPVFDPSKAVVLNPANSTLCKLVKG